MSTSKTITRTDLANILNEVLPTSRYGGIYSATWTSSSHSAYNVRLTNYMNLPAGTYVVIVVSPYVSTGTALICPRVNDTVDYKHLQSCPTGGISNGAFIVSLNSASTVAVYSEGSTSTTYSNIERAGIYAIQISDAKYNTNQADYIVEQGTSGIWTYRKWNSGIAECWGEEYASVDANSVDNSHYVQFPFTFKVTPVVLVGLKAGGSDLYDGWAEQGSTTASQVRLTLINRYSSSVTMYAQISVHGRWK